MHKILWNIKYLRSYHNIYVDINNQVQVSNQVWNNINGTFVRAFERRYEGNLI